VLLGRVTDALEEVAAAAPEPKRPAADQPGEP
jgi:hypothetical protein